jgi:hypothetical protein
MAYSRRYRRSRGRRSQKRYIPRKPPSRWSVYKRAFYQLGRDVQYVKNSINVEYKACDLAASVNPTSGAMTKILINGLTKGDDFSNRDGRQIRLKSLQCAFTANMHGSASDTGLRCLLVIDKKPATLTFNDSALLDGVNLLKMRNLSNRNRFVILKDFVINMHATNKHEVTTKFYKKVDLKTIYNSANFGDIQDIENNAVYLVFLSDEATNVPQVDYQIRARFIDN